MKARLRQMIFFLLFESIRLRRFAATVLSRRFDFSLFYIISMTSYLSSDFLIWTNDLIIVLFVYLACRALGLPRRAALAKPSTDVQQNVIFDYGVTL